VAAGALASGLALSQAEASLAIAAAAAGLACFAWLRAPRLAVVAAALLLAGSAGGDARLRALDHASTLIRDGRTMSVRAHLLTRPRPSAFGASAEARLRTGSLAGARVLLRFANRGAYPPLPHGTASWRLPDACAARQRTRTRRSTSQLTSAAAGSPGSCWSTACG
jgi:hypothetical protein